MPLRSSCPELFIMPWVNVRIEDVDEFLQNWLSCARASFPESREYICGKAGEAARYAVDLERYGFGYFHTRPEKAEQLQAIAAKMMQFSQDLHDSNISNEEGLKVEGAFAKTWSPCFSASNKPRSGSAGQRVKDKKCAHSGRTLPIESAFERGYTCLFLVNSTRNCV